MAIIENTSELKFVSMDINLRCDPLHVININKHEEGLRGLNVGYTNIAEIAIAVNNGVNYPASLYSLEPTSDIYVSVKEIGNGIPLMKNSEDNFKETILFLKEGARDDDKYETGKIKNNEIIIARSGAVGKSAWLGEFLNENDETNFIASGFTTKIKVKEGNSCKFLNLWLNQNFIKDFLIAKSSGKCQRNISQDYIYSIPVPKLSEEDQIIIGDNFYNRFVELENELLNSTIISKIVDSIIEELFNININIERVSGVFSSFSSLDSIAEKYNLRCDAKQNVQYNNDIINLLHSIPNIKLGKIFDGAFIKGKQPIYMDDQEDDGVNIISTLAIQDHAIIIENCKKISLENYDEDDAKPQIGDILITLDGAVSVGKTAYFDIEDDYSIDSHIGIIRLGDNVMAKLISYLLGSKLCETQFRLFESGATSMSLNEVDLREIKIPLLDESQQVLFFEKLDAKFLEREQTKRLYFERKTQLNQEYLDSIRERSV